MKDNFLATRTVIYRTEPSAEDMAILRQQEALQAVLEPTDEQSEELASLCAERVLVDEYRYTLSAYSVVQKARREANTNKARAWIGAATGVPFTESSTEDENSDGIDRDSLFYMSWAWATILPAITLVEVRQVDMLGDYKTEWTPETIPEGWKDIDTFLASVRDDLFFELRNRANELNPHLLLGVPQDELSKKFGVVSAA